MRILHSGFAGGGYFLFIFLQNSSHQRVWGRVNFSHMLGYTHAMMESGSGECS